MGLLRTLLIIALVYYGMKFLAKLFAPYLQKYAAKKMQEKFNQQFNANQGNTDPKTNKTAEGETTVFTKPKDNTNINTDNTGDYIDFEEVDDKDSK